MRGAIGNDFNQEALRAILTNVAQATGKANILAGQAMQLAQILTKNAAKAGPDAAAMAANLRAASASVKSTTELVRTLLATSPIPRDAAVASGNIRKATEDLAAMSGNLMPVFADPLLRDKLQSALGNMHKATENLAFISGEAAKILNDDQLGTALRETLTQMKAAATSVAKITATYEGVLTDPKFTTDVREAVSSARLAAETGAEAIDQRLLERRDVDTQLAVADPGAVAAGLDHVDDVEGVQPACVVVRQVVEVRRVGAGDVVGVEAELEHVVAVLAA